MNFGVFCPRSRADASGLTPDAWNRLLRAEGQGYDSIWLGDIGGFPGETVFPVFAPAAHLAVQTEKIRIGVALPLGADLHPLRLSEEIATLDVMTAGRIQWAAAWRTGKGDGAKTDADDARAREQIAIAIHAWTHGRVGWEGGCYRFPEVSCIPSSVQAPPPTFVLSADPGVRSWGREAGCQWMGPPLEPFSAERADREGTVLRHVYVGANHHKAREEARESLRAVGREMGLGKSEMALESFVDDRALIGDALYCRERIAEWRESAPLDSLVLYPDFPELAPESLDESQVRFIEEVAPAFA
ncbi:MAG: LLM class flavin-dependent oxidoreductase [Myxococcota bacterium]|nr:LLM class flavin-dependent oxidoreductase [Myxococcota bacterium]